MTFFIPQYSLTYARSISYHTEALERDPAFPDGQTYYSETSCCVSLYKNVIHNSSDITDKLCTQLTLSAACFNLTYLSVVSQFNVQDTCLLQKHIFVIKGDTILNILDIGISNKMHWN